ncbi:GDP-mannose 4,6-dehydratase [Bradyrhizobium sp. McL0615]|uniref:GDP-mannose 4,6-dehydratase n=1 Tax=Bradyrhizobium sp. McL0615 TaxID=3415673 RepID=UPI003CEF8AE3
MIIHAPDGKPLPVYGDGCHARDWLHVSDHCEALMKVIEGGLTGETYNVGRGNERSNRNVVGLICDTFDRAFASAPHLAARFPSCPAASGSSCRTLIGFVTDRPGHDQRYAIDATRLANELGSRRSVGFESGIGQTVHWYLDHEQWWRERRLQGLDRQELRLSDEGLAIPAHACSRRCQWARALARRGLNCMPECLCEVRGKGCHAVVVARDETSN